MPSKTVTHRSTCLAVVLGGVLAASVGRAQLSTESGASSARGHSLEERTRKVRDGATVEEIAARLSDADPAERVGAVKSLTQTGSPEVKNYLIESLDDTDPRVQAAAIDGLVRLRARDASPALAQRLFLKGNPKAVRERILSALARIGEPATARSILDFARETPDAELRATAFYAVGEIGDPSIRADLEKMAERESDEATRRVATDALAKIARRASSRETETRAGSR